MSLSRLQSGLQDIYELDIDHDVDNFVITSKEILQQIHEAESNRYAREKLLVHQDEEGLNLSLYLDEAVLQHYVDSEPLEELGQDNIQSFCLVLEGISHFLYLAWNASYDRSVTLLEMELQAEVDKYVMLLQCSETQARVLAPGQLLRMLFENSVYHADLSRAEMQRYRLATRLARQYCRRLESRYLQGGNRRELLSELRKFYRLGKRGKLERIGGSY